MLLYREFALPCCKARSPPGPMEFRLLYCGCDAVGVDEFNMLAELKLRSCCWFEDAGRWFDSMGIGPRGQSDS